MRADFLSNLLRELGYARATLYGIAAVILSSLLWMPSLHAGEQHDLGPIIPKAKGERCVEPTELMRRRHHKFILHQRDETVHRGIRSEKYRFTRCIDCHIQATAAGDYPRHDDDSHFCTVCHRYSSVSIDCFQCHADRPAQAYSTIKFNLNAILEAERRQNDLSLRFIQQHLNHDD